MLPLEQFTAYIKKNALFFKDDKILLTVSGGKDSVLMAQLFKLSNYNFSIAHCNFNLRGDEAQRDESFVKLLAATLGVPFYVTHFDTNGYANEHKISTQMAARDLRYKWFEKIRNEGGYNYVALAHHQNDAIETLLLNLTRGTGIGGLHGILPKRDKLIRPLLFLSRQQIDDLIESENIAFVEDSSNKTTKYARNKIRLNVVPQLRDINPDLEHTFAENIKRFSETEEVLRQAVAQKRSEITREKDGIFYFSIEQIKKLRPQKLFLFELLTLYHFTDAVVDEILESLTKQSGTSFYSISYRATINRDDLIISPLPIGGALEHQFIHPQDEIVKIESQKISIYFGDSIVIEDDQNKAFVDFEKLIFPLIVRFRQDGDRFIPLGMRQFKKLSDFLISNKIPLPQKERIPLLVNGNGEIIWVAGLRLDNRYKVNATTKKVAIFELSN